MSRFAFLLVVFYSAAASAESKLLFLAPTKAPQSAQRTRERFINTLALALDTHRIVRESVPQDFVDAPNAERFETARAAMQRAHVDEACWLDVLAGELAVTLFVRRGEHVLSRTVHSTDDALDQLALDTRELLASAYTWETPAPPKPPEPTPPETIATPPPPDPPTAPLGDATGLVFAAGFMAPIGTHELAPAMPLLGLGVAWSRASGLEARLMIEGGLRENDPVKRTRINARSDVGWRFGDGLLSFIPTAVARAGWLHTRYEFEGFDDALLQLGASPEARLRLGAFTIALHPEFLWNINPLTVQRSSGEGPESRDPTLALGAHLILTQFF